MLRRRALMDLIFGGDGVKYEGTFTGNGTGEMTIPLDFEPDYVYVKRTNLQVDVNAAYGCAILRDMYSGSSYTAASGTNIINGGRVDGSHYRPGRTLYIRIRETTRRFQEAGNCS